MEREQGGARGQIEYFKYFQRPAMYAARVLVALTCKAHQVDYSQTMCARVASV